MLKAILIGLAVVVVLLLGVGMLLPRECHVERSIAIDAPPANVYTLLDGYALMNEWSPWYSLDPGATYAISGPPRGVGAKISWKGRKIGEGSQEIVAASPGESITSKLEFTNQSPAQVRFQFSPEGAGTKVVWSMDADMGAGPIGRYFGLFMDRMVGGDYEKGLRSIKSLVERMPKADVAGLSAETVEMTPIQVAYVEASSSQDLAAIGAAIGASLGKVGAFMKANGLSQAGPVMTINRKRADGVYEFDAAVPVDKLPEKEIPADSPVRIKETPAGRVVKVVHKGAYAALPATYEKLEAYVALRGLKIAGPAWDEYISDPVTTAEAELITNVYQPVH